MNIYPNNFYSNYQYHNAYPSNQFSTQPTMNNFNSNLTTPQNYSMNLLGKIVDGEDIVKATEVPLGSFGVFPKADLSEIYVKTWNSDGTAQIKKYKTVQEEVKKEEDINTLLLTKLADIEKKLNSITPAEKRKELNMNVY